MENLSLRLTTYEVLSLGPSYGIIQMIRDATTIDSLKRNLKNTSLKEFFHSFYDN
jgi:phosphatidylinositol 4-kinase